MGEFYVFIAYLIFDFSTRVLQSQSRICHSNDFQALTDFQIGLRPIIDTWNDSDCCSWEGVTCKSLPFGLTLTKRVVGLELAGKQLHGNLSDSLGNLDQLKILNISDNSLSGNLPTKLFQLQKLEVLDLHDNQFLGPFPGNITIPLLQFLDVSHNYLSGTVDTNFCNISSSIQTLHLSTNRFSGNFLAGLGNCISLKHLSLSSNCFVGKLPGDLFQLKQLRELHLQDNSFSGPLSGEVANLSNLVELDISVNEFSGILPDVFTSFRSLESFIARSNHFVGSLPKSLSVSPSIQYLDVKSNSFSGPIYVNCTAMTQLSSLTLSSNNFNGHIPKRLSLCRKLRTLNLARNQLGGQVPDSFKDLQSLSQLSLSNNGLHNLSGGLGILQHCRDLTVLVLTSNFYGEEIPAYQNLQFKSLQVLVVPYCSLTGSIPKWLSSCTSLRLLDLSWNHLSGTIPEWFNELKFLYYIDLSNNSLSGEIPKSLAKMRSLNRRSVHVEETSLDIPLLRRSDPRGRAREYNQIWRFQSTMDFSYNRLTGPIWPGFGDLVYLCVLVLKWNNLSGMIPPELSFLQILEVLDLSHNSLTGSIPPSLSGITTLAEFSIAYNHLYGMVPLGGQFTTFPCSSFEGNIGLDHLYCNHPPQTVVPYKYPALESRGKKPEITITNVPFGIGIITGFLLAVMFCGVSGLLFPKGHKRVWSMNLN